MHEVTSAQAFESLRMNKRPVRRPDLTLATVDHNVPTEDRRLPNPDPLSAQQIEVLRENCKEFGVPLWDIFDIRQGIVHIISPEHGLTQPGMTIVCGDSHTATHGAFGALAFGIGTSEVEHVLATQTLPQAAIKTMSVEVTGELKKGVTAKDVVLAVIRKIGVDGGIGHVIEYRGDVIRNLSMEGRMTICNMTIEGGARAGLVAPDETTFAYMKGRDFAPLYLSTRAPAWRTEFFYEHATIQNINFIPSSEALVRKDWKYLLWPDFKREQLFDLRADPQEENDVIADPAQAARLKEMRQRFAELKVAAR